MQFTQILCGFRDQVPDSFDTISSKKNFQVLVLCALKYAGTQGNDPLTLSVKSFEPSHVENLKRVAIGQYTNSLDSTLSYVSLYICFQLGQNDTRLIPSFAVVDKVGKPAIILTDLW